MKKFLITVIILVVAILGFKVLYQKTPKLPVSPSETSATTTIQGMFTCLPHKNTSGPQTLECAFGLKDNKGSNYAMDLSGLPASTQDLPFDRQFSVTGLLVPLEALSTDYWQRYDIKGIIKVSSYEELNIKTVPINSKATVGLNESIKVNEHIIRVSAVTEDSRCASDVNCIWGGRVKVALSINSPSGVSSMEIEPGKTVTTETLAITLDSVNPYPISTHKTSDSEYKFVLTINSR